MNNILHKITSNKLYTIDNSIARGIDFLYKKQLNYGEFTTFISLTKEMKNDCYICPVSSPYVTTFILYSLSFLQNIKIKEIVEKALRFLVEEREDPGIWRFYTKKNRRFSYSQGAFVRKDIVIFPDLDDTACVSYSLFSNNFKIANNKNVFLKNRNYQGIFYTWLPELNQPVINTLLNGSKGENNDICCGVNANILLYLGESEETKPVCDYLNYVVINNKELDNCVYFHDKIVFYYLFSRAYFNGAFSLKSSNKLIIERLLKLQTNSGSFGDLLSTVLVVCILLNFQYIHPCIQKAIDFILSNQLENGSWCKNAFFIDNKPNYYGSEELTTAFCLEALSRFRSISISDKK